MLRSILALVTLVSTAHATAWTPGFDVRVREEILDGVYHFAPERDRDWVRVRARVGMAFHTSTMRFEARLDNEHRYLRTPRAEPDYDEVIVDRALWSWAVRPTTTLTVGRQDILWPGGFLVLEGHPLDGSRSMYHDGVRVLHDTGTWAFDGAVVHNRKRDGFVLVDDVDRALTDADETGVMLRAERAGWALSAIAKFESDPDDVLEDLGTWTLGLRRTRTRSHAEIAVQHQNGTVRAAANDAVARGTGFALAGEGAVRWPLPGGWTLETGGYAYSGLDGDLRPFRTPWGRWPKWSEMYLYSLIGESTPGRVHVAAWEDLAAPRLAIDRPLPSAWTDALLLRGVVDALWSPSTGDARGVLTELALNADFGGGVTAHLLWERLVPGAFHDGRHGLPAIDGPVQFFRWQLAYSW